MRRPESEPETAPPRAQEVAPSADTSELLGLAHDVSGVALSVFLNSELADAELARLEQDGVEIPLALRTAVARCRDAASGARSLRELSRQLVTQLRGQKTTPANGGRFNLSTLTESIRALLEPRAAERGLSLNLTSAPDVMLVGDYESAWRLLFNLVDNAIRYTPRGTVTASVALHPSRGLRLEVRDTGVGMQGARPAARRGTQGMGIGFSVILRKVEALGGVLRVTDEPGGGTRIRVDLPFTIADAELTGRDASPLRGKRLLLFDSDLWRRTYQVHLLQRLGAAVFSFNPETPKAVRRAKSLEPDLILVRWSPTDPSGLRRFLEPLADALRVPVRVLCEDPARLHPVLGPGRCVITPEQALELSDDAFRSWLSALSAE